MPAKNDNREGSVIPAGAITCAIGDLPTIYHGCACEWTVHTPRPGALCIMTLHYVNAMCRYNHFAEKAAPLPLRIADQLAELGRLA